MPDIPSLEDVKKLSAKIREHESQQSLIRRTNERELPKIQALVSSIKDFQFLEVDKDLEDRMLKVSETIKEFAFDNINETQLAGVVRETSEVLSILYHRYHERLEAHASRQNNL